MDMSKAGPSGVIGGDNVSRAITLTIISILILGIQDATAKLLVQDYSSFQIVMMRYWGFAAFSLYLVLRQGPLRQAFRSKMPGWQILRGLLLVADIWLFAIGIKTVPLAELQAIGLIYPLLVTLFAIPILGEKVGIFRSVAVIVGFGGALIIIRPGGLEVDQGVIFVALASTFYAIYIVITRKVATQDTVATNMAYVGAIGLVLTTAVGLFHWQAMDWRGVLLVLVVISTTCIGHGLMMTALSMAPASVLQPFNYFALPWGIILSVVIFGHMIDPISLMGAAIIAGAGLVVMARERQKNLVVPTQSPVPGNE